MIGEDDTSNVTTNKRLREAGESAQAEFERETANITITLTEKEKELINAGGVAYFYYRENGDIEMKKEYTEQVRNYIKNSFGRPNLTTRGPFA